MLGIRNDTILTVCCNDKVYEINLSNMVANTYDLEGNSTDFCDSVVEFDSLLDRLYTVFRYGLINNLSDELRSEISLV